jgi:hypothetical protein
MDTTIIGYGSFFHKADVGHIEEVENSFLGEHQLFYAGRYAMKFIFEAILQQVNIKTIWLPEYYCPFVKTWLEHSFNQIKYYNIDPFDAEAPVDWAAYSTTDIVLVNNFWGLKENPMPIGERPIIIEDHSHGWLSRGCIQSEADFCIASLRKTLPIPLGGIAWKPKKSASHIAMPQLSVTKDTGLKNQIKNSWNAIAEAMYKKAICTQEKNKALFLSTYTEGESLLRDSHHVLPMDKDHKTQLQNVLFKNFNTFKAQNLTYIKTKLKHSPYFKVIASNNKVAFGLLLIFKNRKTLTSLKHLLVSNAIYPAELWPKNKVDYDYSFLLNVHIDFRYDQKDLDYIADTLNNYNHKTVVV